MILTENQGLVVVNYLPKRAFLAPLLSNACEKANPLKIMRGSAFEIRFS